MNHQASPSEDPEHILPETTDEWEAENGSLPTEEVDDFFIEGDGNGNLARMMKSWAEENPDDAQKMTEDAQSVVRVTQLEERAENRARKLLGSDENK